MRLNSGRLNQPSSHFTLSPTSGELRTSSRLDREGRDGSDSVDLVALSSSPTYPIEASHLLISNFFHMSLNKWRAGSPIMWVRGGVMDMSEHMGQHCASTTPAQQSASTTSSTGQQTKPAHRLTTKSSIQKEAIHTTFPPRFTF